MMDQIIIKDLLVRGIIGINEDERKNPQDILINIIMFTDTHKASQSDSISDCVNYRTITKKIMSFVEKSQRFTVEALANDVARLCIEDPLVDKVRVRVEKPGAVRFTRSVGVEIERSRSGG
jgi:FolB domain-containing protein